MTKSARIGLPLIQPGQIDKAVTHNEALAILDVAVAAAVDGMLANSPPASPTSGSCYIVGSNPQGEWAGHPLALAGYTDGGWRFVEAADGLSALDKATGEIVTCRNGSWEAGHVHASKLSVGGNQVVGARQAAVPDPSGGTIVDAEARGAIAAILVRLRQHGLIAT